MKKIYTLLTGLMLVFCLSSLSFAREIVVLNDCDFPLNALRLMKTDSDTAYNVLESPLGSQEAIKITMNDTHLAWNVLAEDPAGSVVTFENIIFEGIKQIHIKSDGTVEIYR